MNIPTKPVILTAVLAMMSSLAAEGATYTVDRLTDRNSGGGGERSGLIGDLRYCIEQANTAAGRDVVSFQRGLAGTEQSQSPASHSR
jgi:hypothetical protein